MKYNPKLPDETVNHPKRNLLLDAIKLMVSLALIVSVVYGALLFGVDYAVSHLSAKQEKKLMQYTKVDFDMQKTKESPYLQKITDKLGKCAKLPYKIETYILEADEVNAFAVPGGKIMVTRGMLKRLKSENELAFIIGHELGHFKHRDHLKGLGKSLILGLFSMFVGESYGSVFDATLQVTDAKYSQSQELDADRFGLDLMACAYGDVTDATALFARMDRGKSWKYFLASHPSFKERVEKMRRYIEEKGYLDKGRLIPLPKRF
jgi:Zn-dependent protease with chaperone function